MNHETIIVLTAFAGLAGALLTQFLTGLFSYIADKRKYKQEVKSLYRAKKTEVGEAYFYVMGETMAALKKSSAFWMNRNDSRSKQSTSFICHEMGKADEQLAKVNAENWKASLISLYFNVRLSVEELVEANQTSHKLYLNLLDTGEQVNQLKDTTDDQLYGLYNTSILALCSQYDQIYDIIDKDMQAVKDELIKEFSLS